MSEPDTEFDVDRIAEALRKRVEEWKPSKRKLYDKIKEPKILELIQKLKRSGANGKEIVNELAAVGIQTTPQTLGSYLRKIDAEAKGEGNAKPKRERQESKPTTSAATPKRTASEAPKQATTKPAGSASEPNPEGKSTSHSAFRKA